MGTSSPGVGIPPRIAFSGVKGPRVVCSSVLGASFIVPDCDIEVGATAGSAVGAGDPFVDDVDFAAGPPEVVPAATPKVAFALDIACDCDGVNGASEVVAACGTTSVFVTVTACGAGTDEGVAVTVMTWGEFPAACGLTTEIAGCEPAV